MSDGKDVSGSAVVDLEHGKPDSPKHGTPSPVKPTMLSTCSAKKTYSEGACSSTGGYSLCVAGFGN